MPEKKNVGILIFDEVEVLDFCGPFEVFSVTGKRQDEDFFNVYTIAERPDSVFARNRLSINPHYTIFDCPKPDILIIPGGFGTRKEMSNEVLINWIKQSSVRAELVLSVCTGALLLAKAELLENLKATTHHGATQLLRDIAPNTQITHDRYIDNGKFILSAGISAGIDMSLYVVSKLLGKKQADETATYMEYDWNDNQY